MQLTPLLKLAAVLAVGAFVCVAQAAEGVASDRIPVEIWRHGDIGSTVKLADAIEAEIYGPARFARSTGKRTGTLIISIIQAVEQVEAASRSQSWYRVEFATADGKKLGTSSGACWSDELLQCAKRVRADAEFAALRLARGVSQ